MRRMWAGLLLCMGGFAFADLTSTDVPSNGSVVPAGSAVEDPAGTWTINGAGADIWGTADQFFFLYDNLVVSGDFAISCHVQSLAGGDVDWAKAGLMARVPDYTDPEFQTSGQQYNFLCVTSSQGVCHQFRDVAGADASDTQDAGTGTRVRMGPNDIWLKLVREGDTFSTYLGPAKGAWVASPGSHTNLSLGGAEMYVGLAITSHLAGQLATAVIDDVDFDAGPVSLNGPTDLACVTDGPSVNLTWTNNAAYTAITLWRRLASTGAWTQIIVPATAQSYMDVPGEGSWTYYITAAQNSDECASFASCQALLGPGVIGADGYFQTWLLFGPIADTYPCNTPYDALIGDFLTDGTTTEKNILPRPYDSLTPGFALSENLGVSMMGPYRGGTINPDAASGVGVWYLYTDSDGLINLNDDFYDGDPDYCMTYAVIYLNNTLTVPRFLIGACNSDDSIAVALDNAYFWTNGACRGDNGGIADRFPLFLPPGEHRLMVKTFEEGGGFNFRFRLENQDGTVLTSADDIEIRYVPTMTAVPPAPTATATRALPSVMIPDYEATVSIATAIQTLDLMDLVPDTMTIGTVGNGGTTNGQLITWTNIPAGTTVTYTVTPSVGGGKFQGVARETATNLGFAIGGQSTPLVPAEFVDGWLSADIADSGQAGTATVTKTGTTYTMDVTGSGHDIWDTADDFRFVWKSFPADKSLVMQCQLRTMINGTNVWSKYGLMFRTYPTQGSPSVYAVYSRDGGEPNPVPDGYVAVPDPAFQWRDAVDGGAAMDDAFWAANQNHPLPGWIRMFYQDGSVTAYFADDDGGFPGEWYPAAGVSHTLNLEGQDSFLAGVCVTAHDDGQSTTGYFEQVEIVSLCEPVTVTRSFGATTTANLNGVPATVYEDGTDMTVSLALTNPRVADASCPALGEVTITELIPPGFTAKDISDGGTPSGDMIVWTFAAGSLPAGPLTYTISGVLGANTAQFAGEVSEMPAPNIFGPFETLGATTIVATNGLGIDPGIEGVVLSWLLLGPFGTNAYDAATGGNFLTEMQRDYLTDGVVDELTVTPSAGDEIMPDYGNLSAALDLRATANTAINPKYDQGIATWYPVRYAAADVDFIMNTLYGANDYAMNYSVAYLDVREDVDVIFAIGSDDSVQVLLDGAEIWTYTGARDFTGFVDFTGMQTLDTGIHMLMVKTFNSAGGFNQGVQILNSDMSLFMDTDIICVTLDPDGCGGGVQPDTINVLMGNVNTDTKVDIADAIALLGYLFGGGTKPAPQCAKAADANDDNKLDIADAIKILGYLFSQQAMLAPDHSTVTAATNTCKPYAADGIDSFDGKPYFPAQVSGLEPCVTPCVP